MTKIEIEPTSSKIKSNKKCPDSKQKNGFQKLIEEEQREQELRKLRLRAQHSTPWLRPDIVIKIKTKSLGEKYYKQKAQVLTVFDKGFKANIQLIASGEKLSLDQDEAETVVPAVGRRVLVLTGKYRDRLAELLSLQVDQFSANLKLCDGSRSEISLPYEHFSKFVEQ